MNLADILSSPPTGRSPGTSPKRLPRRSHSHSPSVVAAHVTPRPDRSGNAEPARPLHAHAHAHATRLSPDLPPSDSSEPSEPQLYPQLPDNHTSRIPGDQILQSLSHFNESDFDTSDPDLDAPSNAPPDVQDDDTAHVFGYYLGNDDSDCSESYPSENDDRRANMDDIDYIDLSETLERAARPQRPGTSQNNHSRTHRPSQASSRNSPRSFHEVHASRQATADRKRQRPASRASTSRPTTSAAPASSSTHNSTPRKRPRRPQAPPRASKPPDADIPSVNLVDGDDAPAPASSTTAESAAAKLLSDSIAQQQQQQATAPDPAATKLTASTCSICMSAPREAIATVCGHLFCRACLTQWLGHAAQRTRKRATCPSCRAGISVPTGAASRAGAARSATVVNLEFKRKRAAPVTVG